jgi:hypothetical protein
MTAATLACGEGSVLPVSRYERVTMLLLTRDLSIGGRLYFFRRGGLIPGLFFVQWWNTGENNCLYFVSCLSAATKCDAN